MFFFLFLFFVFCFLMILFSLPLIKYINIFIFYIVNPWTIKAFIVTCTIVANYYKGERVSWTPPSLPHLTFFPEEF